MTFQEQYKPWTTVSGVRVELGNGIEIQIPWVAGVDAQAVIDTITITTYFSYMALLRRVEEDAGED